MEANLLQVGSKAGIKLNSYATRTFRGNVVVVSPKGEQQGDSHVFFARVLLPNPDSRIRRVWKDAGRSPLVGIRLAMCCSGARLFGFIPGCGPGSDGRMSPMKSKNKNLLLVSVGAAILQGGCGVSKPETAAAAPSASPTPISAASPSTTPALIKTEDYLMVSGPLIVEHQVDVTAQRDGIVLPVCPPTPVSG